MTDEQHTTPSAALGEQWCAIVDAIAARALAAAVDGDLDAAAQVMLDAAPLPGPRFDRMMITWVDTMLRYLGFPAVIPDDALVQLGFCRSDTLATVDLDEVPPAKQWAGRFMAARAALDLDTLAALQGVDGGGSYPERVLAVLTGVAATLRHTQLRDSAGVPIT